MTPLRRQYLDIKRRHPGLVVFFQVGDFYETFDDDAKLVAHELGIALTRKWFGKGAPVPLAGIPVRSLNHHLSKLINRGHKVAICDQLTPPGKGLVERDVVRIITPGTVIEPGLLEANCNNYLASLALTERRAGLAYADITTGEFATTELERDQALAELHRLAPAEVLVADSADVPKLAAPVTRLDPRESSPAATRAALLEHFGARTLAAVGCETAALAALAAGAIIAYLKQTQPEALDGLVRLRRYSPTAHMRVDEQSLRNLEVFQGWAGGTEPGNSLLGVIDQTRTPPGGRLLRKWLRHPLLDTRELTERQDAIEWFVNREAVRGQLRAKLEQVADLERLLSRTRRALATPAEVVALSQSLAAVPALRALLERHGAPRSFYGSLDECGSICELVSRALADHPRSNFERGGVIRAEFSGELDELRELLGGGKKFLAALEASERTRTGIRSLRVGYNKVFGYYLEVTKPNLSLVPADYIRKQTLSNAERFFTLELKEHEALVANAQERMVELESSLFRQVCLQIGAERERVSAVAAAVAYLDVCSALAEVAARQNYCRPRLTDGGELIIKAGRHPLLERRLAPGEFVANDAELSNDAAQVIILTGPNMSGKSTYLRQTALIALLAQAGSFVPAAEATVGIVDRIFTRIGLHDQTGLGQSSFMVEMVETAEILHQATPRSLILLDEVGRGTSTADGLSLARAVVEYLHNHPRLGAKTLFATHYHELTECADLLPRARNLHVAVEEKEGKVRFLHRIESGRAAKSFGLYVAQLAGMPRPVIRRAQELLDEYERGHAERPARRSGRNGKQTGPTKELLGRLLTLDINDLSPVEALTKLYSLQQLARELAPHDPPD